MDGDNPIISFYIWLYACKSRGDCTRQGQTGLVKIGEITITDYTTGCLYLNVIILDSHKEPVHFPDRVQGLFGLFHFHEGFIEAR